ncbi:MAG TPA: NAD(P)H-dependent oxidoreductase [Clostridia bacterium]|nr:NAD(P)H-dependent oxidoreductase [Clostridia bacterium]
MKKLLYITVSSKPENMSVSRQAGRAFLKSFQEDYPGYELEELDLATYDLPEPNYRYFKGWVELVSGAEYDALPEPDQEAVDRMNSLCTQFLAADITVIAAPMWSMSFPFRLKQYLDCIMLNNRLIRLTPTEATGLLNDKVRKMVYIQSSGGIYPKIFDGKFNMGIKYFHDLFLHLGVKDFYKILIQGTDMVDVGKEKALQAAQDDFDDVLDKICG